MKKMILGGIITMMVALLAAPTGVQAQYSFTTNADGITVTLTGYSGAGGNLTIPATNDTGLPVTIIGPNAFSSLADLDSVIIPEGVTDIDVNAFGNCDYLTNVTIPDSVTNIGVGAFETSHGLTTVTIGSGVLSIGELAFVDCIGLTSVTIPGSLITIGESAFENCSSLTNATIANGVLSIGGGAFYGCTSLASVTIPASVTNIEGAFPQCTGLTAITVDANNQDYSSLLGVLFDKREATLLEYPGGKAGSYNIPGTVTTIADYAFLLCTNLSNVRIPGSVTNIGNYAFDTCTSLTNAAIAGGLLSIGEGAFARCSKLTSLYFQGHAPTADWSVFNDVGEGPGDPVTNYYLPGTTGWGEFSANTGHPAVLWNPLIQTGDGSFGVQNGQFGFNITGTTNIPIVVEACANLAGPVWTPLQSLTLTNGAYYFSEPFQPGSVGRYYRISSQ